MNDKNLIPFTSDQSRDEAARNGRKGGIASGEARRERARILKWLKEPGNNGTLADDIALNMIKAAASGTDKDKVRAAELLYKMIGELTEKMSMDLAPRKDATDLLDFLKDGGRL